MGRKQKLRNVISSNKLEINFYTYDEYLKRPDLRKTESEILAKFPQEEGNEIRAAFLQDQYAAYQRRLRTMILFSRLKNIQVTLKVVHTEKAAAYLGQNPNLNWSHTTALFDTMGDAHLEILGDCASTRRNAFGEGSDLKAIVGIYSHAPEYPQIPDFIGAAVFDGPEQVTALASWINPAHGTKAVDGALEALMNELARRNVQEITLIPGIMPLEVCPLHGHLMLAAAQEEEDHARDARSDRTLH